MSTATPPAALARHARAGWPGRGGSTRRLRHRAALARLLWSPAGDRRLPSTRALDRALDALGSADLEWICEFSPLGPLWFLPTREWIAVLARTLEGLGVQRVVEVAAGDGFLSRELARAAPDLEVLATDSGSWERSTARMSPGERRTLSNVEVPGVRLGDHVRRLDAITAVDRLKPDLVLAVWLPPGRILDRLIRSPVRYVLEVGGLGATPGQWSWRFSHEIWNGPLERLARCRLDGHPRKALHTRVTLYRGAAHPDHHEERVRRGDWLWQFRPRS